MSKLLGLRVDYYALVNLLGFADLVDALGGVEIDVKERLVDEVTRPAWGERKPRIDVVPGRTYRFYGREALAYVRSRKTSNDYTRMARQRCFLSAMADQLDPVRVLRNFGSLAKTIETNVHTDIPLNRLPSLVRLVSAVDREKTLTVTFGLDYFFGRRIKDRHPVPNIEPDPGRRCGTRSSTPACYGRPERLRQQGRAASAQYGTRWLIAPRHMGSRTKRSSTDSWPPSGGVRSHHTFRTTASRSIWVAGSGVICSCVLRPVSARASASTSASRTSGPRRTSGSNLGPLMIRCHSPTILSTS